MTDTLNCCPFCGSEAEIYSATSRQSEGQKPYLYGMLGNIQKYTALGVLSEHNMESQISRRANDDLLTLKNWVYDKIKQSKGQ